MRRKILFVFCLIVTWAQGIWKFTKTDLKIAQESCPTRSSVYAQWRADGNSLSDSSGQNHPLHVPTGNVALFSSSAPIVDGPYFNFLFNTGHVNTLVVPSFTMPTTFSFCAHVNARGCGTLSTYTFMTRMVSQ